MSNNSRLITRRQVLASLSALSGAALVRPASIFGSPVKDPLRFAVIGDFGTGGQDEVVTAKQMFAVHQRTPFDLIITTGDNIYPNGSERYFVRNFEQPFAALIADRVRFYAVLGNHDVEAGRQDQLRYKLFNMGGENYYKFERGGGLIEFFMLDSTAFNATQATWLENSLGASRAIWKLAVFHHPIYSSGKKHGSALDLKKQIEPIFIRYGVNVVFSGHDHVYERAKPQHGIQYFVSGGGGKVRHGDINPDSGIRQASFDDQNHFMVIDVEEKQMAFQAISEDGAVVDSGLIKQS
jgi:3',5'-cyclic AMP phosphodiesterase CpdA